MFSTTPSFSVSVELDRVAISDVAARADDADAAVGAHLAAAPVPGHAVGGEVIAFAGHPDLARGGHHLSLVVIDELVGAELDLDRLPVGIGGDRAGGLGGSR